MYFLAQKLLGWEVADWMILARLTDNPYSWSLAVELFTDLVVIEQQSAANCSVVDSWSAVGLLPVAQHFGLF